MAEGAIVAESGDAMVEDHEMAGVETGPANGAESDDDSEDLEGSSSGSEDDELEEEEAEGAVEVDDAMEMDVDVEKPLNVLAPNDPSHHQDAVMAH